MLFGLFWGDWTMIVLIPAFIFALWAQLNVKLTYSKYSKIPNRRGISGAEAARRILDGAGLYNVRIERVSGELTDHYDPKNQVIRLSDATYDKISAAAVGVAAHEAGHAIQHAQGYAPLKLRNAIIPVTNIGSQLSMPLFLIGFLLSMVAQDPTFGLTIMLLGIIAFSFSTIFQLITLPTEFNASARAMKILKNDYILESDDLTAASKVLRAAALTYVAALATSLAYLLRFLLIFAGASGRRRR